VRHAETVACKIAEATAVVATARRDQAGGGEEAGSRQKVAARSWILPVVGFVIRCIAGLQLPCFNIGQDARPELDTVAQRKGVGMRRALVRAGEHVQASEYDRTSAVSIPAGKLKRAAREGEVHRDADDFRQRVAGRAAVEQVFVPVLDAPVSGRDRREAGERERWRQNVLAEAGVRVLR